MSKRTQKPLPVRIVHDSPSAVSQYREPNRLHMSVRQIKNGYLVNRHGYKDGKHFDEEVYTPHAPNIQMGGTKKPPAPSVRGRGVNTKTRL